MFTRSILALSIAVLVLTVVPTTTAAPPAPAVREIGGFMLEGAFLALFDAGGGVAAFGVPLSDALIEPGSGLAVQYFALARMELHAEGVRLTRLGSALAAGRADEPPFQWRDPAAPLEPGRTYVPESGHTLGGAFGWHYSQHGGVALLGYPISEEFVEAQPDGMELLTQYFERAILVYEPTPDGQGGTVRQLELGALAATRDLSADQLSPGAPLRPLAVATLPYNPATGDGQNMALSAARLNGLRVPPGAELSFLGTIGEVSAAAGYVPGTAIVDGVVVNDEIGGGICNVSTLLYRAAWMAGLPIIERRSHRYRLRTYADAPGLEAAVYTPGQDMRARNDTGAPLYVATSAAAGLITVALWGRGDDRTVRLAPPEERQGGLEVLNARTIDLPSGAPFTQRVLTRYEPLPVPTPTPTPQPRGSGPN